ncbi:helix-turn-helix domain-containing protein [Nocardia cerradoensis]|uniref:helix-turn-helix domain-containing protein n=3 Tax=Nocardia cerradoensis TaxID=85688 RepID=UPI001443A596|nr:helix-turn-helix transcriptional regulator [Nocardia cerradoensis]
MAVAAGVVDGSLGAALRDARVRKGLSLRAAAAGTGLSYTTLYRIESGERDTAPVDALLGVGDRLGIPRATIAALAGGLSREGAQDLAGARVRRAMRGGRLSPAAIAALRRVHVARLLDPFASHLADAPVNLSRLSAAAGLVVRESDGDPGFDVDGAYLLPRRKADPIQRIALRGWLAHGIAHALLAQDAGERPSCKPRAHALEAEREATYLATLIIIPSSPLAATLRLNPAGALVGGDEVGATLDEIASDFDAPAPFAAARLVEDGALAVMPL